MERKGWLLLGTVLALLIIVCAAGCSGSEDEGAKITVNGKEYSWDQMEKDIAVKTVDENTGVSLSALVTDSGVADPETHAYDLVASDGYTKTVTWHFMELGIVMEKDVMSYFPDLPTRYQVKDLVEIKVNDEVKTIIVNDVELTQDMPFDRWFDKVLMNGTEGVSLSAILNFTGVKDPETKQYTITAYDDYSKTVSWDDMLGGIYVQEEHRSYFPDLDTKHQIKDIQKIEVA